MVLAERSTLPDPVPQITLSSHMGELQIILEPQITLVPEMMFEPQITLRLSIPATPQITLVPQVTLSSSIVTVPSALRSRTGLLAARVATAVDASAAGMFR